MNDSERNLHAYHDGELSWWGRLRMEGRLRRSPELREELALLSELRSAAREQEAGIGMPDIWGGIAGRLRVIDAEVESEAVRAGALGGLGWLGDWRPIGAAAVVAGAALALVLALRVGAPIAPSPDVTIASGVHLLDSHGRPVMVVQDTADTTIIWLMDAPVDEA